MWPDIKNKGRCTAEIREAIERVLTEEKNNPVLKKTIKPAKIRPLRNEEITFTTTPTGTENA